MASAFGGAALTPAGAKRALTREGLIVEPEVFVAVAVVDAVDHHGHPLHLGVPAGGLTGVEDHRSTAVSLTLRPTVKSLRMIRGYHCVVSTGSSTPSM